MAIYGRTAFRVLRQVTGAALRRVAMLHVLLAAVFCATLLFAAAPAQAGQTELLVNGNFETPVVPNDGNNFYATIPGWTVVSTTPVVSQPFNLVKPTTSYLNNPSTPPPGGGIQYFDVRGADGIIKQTVTVPSSGVVDISTWFSVRDFVQNLSGNFIQLKDPSGTIIASAEATFTTSDPIGTWRKVSVTGIRVAAGTYTVELVIPNFANTDIASMMFTPDPIPANDSVSVLARPAGTANVLNVLTGDTVDGAAATTSNVTIALAAGSSVPAGLTFDTATGAVSVAAGTAPGTYSFNYSLCDKTVATACGTGTVTVTVVQPDLAVTKTNTPGLNGEVDPSTDAVATGTSATYRITVRNNTSLAVTGAVLSDPAVTGFTASSVTCSATPGQCTTGTTPTVVQLQAGYALPTLAAGQTYQIDVTGTVSGASGNLANVATVAPPGSAADATPADNSATDSDPILPRPTVTIVVTTQGHNTSAPNTSYSFAGSYLSTAETLSTTTASPTATGTTRTLSGAGLVATVTQAAPAAAFRFVSANCAGMGTGGTATLDTINRTITLDAAATAPGATITCTFTNAALPRVALFKRTTGGTGTFTFAVTNADTNISTIAVDGAATITTATAGTAVQFDASSLSGIQAMRLVDPSVPLVISEARSTGWNMDATSTCSVASGGGTVSTAVVNSGTNAGSMTITPPTGGFAAGVLITCQFDNVPSTADLVVSKTDGRTTVQSGGSTSYTITVSSNGPGSVTGAVLQDPAVGGLTITAVSCSGTPGQCTAGTTPTVAQLQAGYALPTLVSGQTYQITLTGTVGLAGGLLSNMATVTLPATMSDPVPGDNSATDSTTVLAVLTAAPDSVSGVNGLTGQAAALNVFAGDTVNGATASPANATLALAVGSSVPTGLSFDPATGAVNVLPGTVAGSYSFNYTLCETVTPSNCQTATVTVVVVAAAISADADSAGGINGADGAANVLDVLAGDTLNGTQATLSQVALSVQSPATPVRSGALVPVLDPATGQVSVPAGTPAGIYTIGYRACERLNPANCADATATITVMASAVVATPDTMGGINGLTGQTAVLNVFAGDTINGTAASLANGTVAVAAGSSVPTGLTFDTATGRVDVAPGTAAGTYAFSYALCEKLNPANCQTATATVVVGAAAITADADSAGGINGADGSANVLDVLAGDMLNGTQATLSQIALSILTPATPVRSGALVPALDPATGQVSVPAGTPAGIYTISYRICERLNPTNCADATASITIAASAVVATADSAGGVNGLTGQTAVLNVFAGDTINGAAALPANAALALATGSSVPAGLTFDPATGAVDAAPGTAAGTYTFSYTLCEKLNPTNCQTAAVSIVVAAAPIVAVADASPAINSAIGGNGVINVLANDTLGGAAIDPAKVLVTTTSPAAPINSGTVPVLDPATGLVNVPPGTPAGTYAIGYRLCERLNPANCADSAVTVLVEPARSVLSGTVYTDTNGNGTLDAGDVRQPGWIVEVLHGGTVVATATTDAQGDYSITGLLSAPGYTVRFRNPETNVVYGVISNLELGANQAVADQNLPIDPSGVVYNAVTRTPVAGARLRLIGAGGTALPLPCFVDPSQQGQVTGASGDYRFDLIPGAAAQCPLGEATYTIALDPPAGFSFVSTVLLPQTGPLDPTGGSSPYRVALSSTAPTDASPVYYLAFRLANGDPHVINNHIPVDPFLTRAPLVVTKTSTRRSASTGDLVPYEITVRNTEPVARAGVDVIDVLPPGMKYVAGSGAVDGLAREPVAANDNRELAWRGQLIPGNGTVRYSLTLVVGAGVTGGQKINTGLAENGANGAEISNRGTATVSIVPSTVFDCSEVLGKVFEDRNGNGYQDSGEPGVPGARLASVNGLLVTTDAYGRYHIACAAVPDARIGSNFVLKLDPRTLPLGWAPTTDNPRSVRLTRGKMSELNFGVAPADRAPAWEGARP